MLPESIELMTELGIGELSYRNAGAFGDTIIAIVQGFSEVLPDRVTVLAETAERAEEIDLARAEAAKARAEQRLTSGDPNIDWDRASVALQRAVIRIQVARRHRGVPVDR